VFVYAIDPRDPRKQKRAQSVLHESIHDRSATISYQAVQEFLNVATTKFETRIVPEDLRVFLDRFLWPICEVFPDLALYHEALSVCAETGWRFFDSLIVSSAVRAGCSVLLSEDLQAGRTVGGVEIRNPFA
jgi:predicted nucleic acid-binding protein